jgi:hypothetical protein
MSGLHRARREGSFSINDRTEGAVRVAEDGDRRTLYLDAPGMTDDDRASYWLSADDDDFCDLDSMR